MKLLRVFYLYPLLNSIPFPEISLRLTDWRHLLLRTKHRICTTILIQNSFPSILENPFAKSKNLHIAVIALYRVTLVVEYLGLDDLDLESSPADGQLLIAQTGWWNIPNLSQPNQGIRPPVSLCSFQTPLKGVLQLNGSRAGNRPRHIGSAGPDVVRHGVYFDGAAGAQFNGILDW